MKGMKRNASSLVQESKAGNKDEGPAEVKKQENTDLEKLYVAGLRRRHGRTTIVKCLRCTRFIGFFILMCGNLACKFCIDWGNILTLSSCSDSFGRDCASFHVSVFPPNCVRQQQEAGWVLLL
ncbi:hypothetical protein VPH35_029921 [Triticum aestivum]